LENTPSTFSVLGALRTATRWLLATMISTIRLKKLVTGPRISIGNHWVPTGATSELPCYSKGKPDSSWCDVSRSARREGRDIA
jgi:hypothetical protein